MREVKDYIDEAFETLEDSYKETSEFLQEKKGILSKVMIEHIDKFYKSKISILRLLRYTPVSIFKDENFRKCDDNITALRINSSILREAIAPVADKEMHYFDIEDYPFIIRFKTLIYKLLTKTSLKFT